MAHPFRPDLCAVVLTGGTGARLGGADKAALEVHGSTLLERALAATAAAGVVVVVGDEVPTSRTVHWTREHPPRGGPAAGLLAGMDVLAAHKGPVELTGQGRLVVVLAVDMARVTAATVDRLCAALEDLDRTSGPDRAAQDGVDGAVLVDDDGRRQVLCGVYRRDALERCRPPGGQHSGLAMRRLVAPLALTDVPALDGESLDVDTWEDLRRFDQDPRNGLRTL